MTIEKILELPNSWGIEEYGERSGVGLRHNCNGEWQLVGFGKNNTRYCYKCNAVPPAEVLGFFELCLWKIE